jgi:hypothetical protein
MTKLSRKTRVILVLLVVASISLYTYSQQIKQKQTQVEPRKIAHFTFKVPIELINLHPDIVEGKVLIRVRDPRATDLIASVEKKFRIVKGNYKGNLVFAFRASPGQRPDLAGFWSADLLLRTKDSEEFKHAQDLTAIPPYEADRSKPFTIYDYGDIK